MTTDETGAEPTSSPSMSGGRTRASVLTSMLLSLDEVVEGRRLRIFVFLGAVQGVIAPLMDGTLSGVQRLGGLRTSARAIDGTKFAGFEGFSLLAILCVIFVGGALLAGRVAALVAPDEETQRPTPMFAALRSLLRVGRAEWRLFRRRDAMEQVLGAGFLSFAGLQTARAVLSFIRWVLWETVVSWFDLGETFVGSALEGVYSFEGFLALLAGGVLALVALVLAVWAWRTPKAGRVAEGRVREVRLLRAEDPLLVVGQDTRGAELGAAFHGDLVTRLLRDITAWTPPRTAQYESEIRDDLAAFLIDRDYDVAMEFSLRRVRRRIDLVVDNCVAIEIKWELRYAGEKDRARSQVVDYARAWSERGPVVVLVVATERPHVDRVAEEAVRWNREFEPERTAPLLVVSHNRVSPEPRQLSLLPPQS